MIAATSKQQGPTTLTDIGSNNLKRTSYVIKKKTMKIKFKKPKRKVEFAAETFDIQETTTPATSFVTNDDLQSRWYSTDELVSFKKTAVQLTIHSANHFGPCAMPRGMEGCTAERLKHQKNTIRCVVLAHKKQKGAEYTAAISQKCSSWNKDLAFHQACRDYFEIYEPNLIGQIPPVQSGPPKIELVKRRSSSVENKTRRT